MKTFLVIAAAAASFAMSTLPAAANDQYRRYFSQLSDAELARYAETYTRPARRSVRVEETHETIRANAADPTRQYDLPDWARAAFAPRGRR